MFLARRIMCASSCMCVCDSAVFQMALSQKYDKYVLDGVSSLYLK